MMPVPTALSFRRVTDTAVGEPAVSPPKDSLANDVNRITFTMPTVAAIVFATVTVVGAQYLSYSSLSSDMRNLETQIEAQKENIELKLKLMQSEIEKSELRKALLEELKAK